MIPLLLLPRDWWEEEEKARLDTDSCNLISFVLVRVYVFLSYLLI